MSEQREGHAENLFVVSSGFFIPVDNDTERAVEFIDEIPDRTKVPRIHALRVFDFQRDEPEFSFQDQINFGYYDATMNDLSIRKAVHSRIVKYHPNHPNSLVIDELGILHGKSRIDIAVINGAIHGYEIKSEEDHLNRLAAQVASYNTVFDKLTLVVAEKHSKTALARIPGWWGVIIASKDQRGGIKLDRHKRAWINQNIDPISVATLLWKPEAIDLLVSIGCSGKDLSGNRLELYRRIVDRLSLGELQFLVRKALKERVNWRGRLQPW